MNAIVLTNEQTKDQLNKRFPITKSHLLILSVTYQDPRVVLHEGSDKVTVGLAVVLNSTIHIKVGDRPPVRLENLGGSCEVTASFRYEPSEFSFYLDSATIDKLHLQGVPDKYLRIVEGLSLKAASEGLRKHPVYTLRDESAKKAVARMLLKDVVVRDGKLHTTLGL